MLSKCQVDVKNVTIVDSREKQRKKNVDLDKKFAPPYIHQCPILCKVSEFCPFNDLILKGDGFVASFVSSNTPIYQS